MIYLVAGFIATEMEVICLIFLAVQQLQLIGALLAVGAFFHLYFQYQDCKLPVCAACQIFF